jgi:hypothetical protein
MPRSVLIDVDEEGGAAGGDAGAGAGVGDDGGGTAPGAGADDPLPPQETTPAIRMESATRRAVAPAFNVVDIRFLFEQKTGSSLAASGRTVGSAPHNPGEPMRRTCRAAPTFWVRPHVALTRGVSPRVKERQVRTQFACSAWLMRHSALHEP